MANGVNNKAFDLMTTAAEGTKKDLTTAQENFDLEKLLMEKYRGESEKSFDEFIEAYKLEGTKSTPTLSSPQEIVDRISQGELPFENIAYIRQLWEVAGKPIIKQYIPNEYGMIWDEKTKKWNKGFFRTSKNYPLKPDVLHIPSGDLGVMIAELGHAFDYKTSKSERQDIEGKVLSEIFEFGRDRYGGYVLDEETHEPVYPLDRWYPKKIKGVRTIFSEPKGPGVTYEPTQYIPNKDRYSVLDAIMPSSYWEAERIRRREKEDIPMEFRAHRVTEQSLWDYLFEYDF